MTDKDGLTWLKNRLQSSGNHFQDTLLYKLLRDELTTLGYWKVKPRGNPRAGYKAMIDKANKQTKDSD